MENRKRLFFSVKQPNIKKNNNQNEHLIQYSNKKSEKLAREKTYWLKLEFYNTDRKVKNIIRRISISIIMHPSFMQFCHKISFKSALETFTSFSSHLRTIRLFYSSAAEIMKMFCEKIKNFFLLSFSPKQNIVYLDI